MEYLRLIGIAIIIVGFLLKFNTIAITIVAGLVTGLVSGMSIIEVISVLGQAFVDNRLVTLFVLTFPMIGISEKYGLKEQAVRLINKVENLTTGRFLTIYLFIRELAGLFSIRLGGHPQFIRPLVEPMAQASTVARYKEVDDETRKKIKAQSAAMENFGNFFAQNTFVGASGTLLIASTLESLGYEAPAAAVAVASIAVAVAALILGADYNLWFDKRLEQKLSRKAGDK